MRCKLLLGLAVAIAVALPPGNAAAAPVVIDTIGLGGGPSGIAVTPLFVYVVDWGANNLHVIDQDRNTPLAGSPIPVGDQPTDVAVDPATGVIYLSHGADNNVSAIVVSVTDGAIDGVASPPPIPVGREPVGLAVNSSTNRLYVTNRIDNTVSVVEAGGVVDTVDVGVAPTDVAVNATTNRVYVANRVGNSVSVIDGTTNDVIETVPVGDGPEGVAVNPALNRVYVTNRLDNTMSVVDAATNAVVQTVDVGESPRGVAATPANGRVYVANAGSNDVSVIDGATNNVVDTVEVGDGPLSPGAEHVSYQIYVTNAGSGTVSVIEDLPEAPPEPEPEPLPGDTEDISLQGDTCNPVSSTYPDGTDIAVIAGAVAPPDMLDSLWQFEGGLWTGYSPDFPAASDLTEMDRLDVVFICVGGSGPGAATFSRPVI